MRACIATLFLVVFASAALAQPSSPAKTVVTVEPIESHWIVVPEAKLTDIDGDLGNLIGLTFGWLQDETFFVGGAGYWLAGGPRNWDLAYGGAVLGMQWRGDRAITFGARGLLGAGKATRAVDVKRYYPFAMPLPTPMHPVAGGWQFTNASPLPLFEPRDVRFKVSNTFFVFEPQANVTFAITRRIRFGVSGGYRLTTSAESFGNDVNGATGTLSLQFELGGK